MIKDEEKLCSVLLFWVQNLWLDPNMETGEKTVTHSFFRLILL